MPLILGANSLAGGGYEVDNSLRFNFGSNDYLNRTASTSSDKKKYTYSVWLKRSVFTEYNRIAQHYVNGDNRGYFMFLKSTDAAFPDTMFIFDKSSAVTRIYWESGIVFRDSSAWYHIVIKADSTQATESERFKVYVNGEDISSQFTKTTTIAQNQNFGFQSDSATHYVGSSETPSEYFNGYMSEINFIDGQALDPTSFGEFDEDSGIWKPIAYTGTYGTNGFFLEFKDSSALGDDTSGNSNDFTVKNLTSIDQTTDTPTNNFCTLNAIQNGNGTTSVLTQGNLVTGTADNKGVASTFGVSKGKWYWEIKMVGSALSQYVGVSNRENEQNGDASPSLNSASIRSFFGNTIFKNYTSASNTSNASFVNTNGAIYSVALDLDNGTLGRYVNGSLISTDTTLPSDNSVTFFPMAITTNSGGGGWNEAQFNFGNPPFTISSGNSDANNFGNFEYAVPSGYYALCTNNLAEYG